MKSELLITVAFIYVTTKQRQLILVSLKTKGTVVACSAFSQKEKKALKR